MDVVDAPKGCINIEEKLDLNISQEDSGLLGAHSELRHWEKVLAEVASGLYERQVHVAGQLGGAAYYAPR